MADVTVSSAVDTLLQCADREEIVAAVVGTDEVLSGLGGITSDGENQLYFGSADGVVIGQQAAANASGTGAVVIGFFAASEVTALQMANSVRIGRHSGYRAVGGNDVCIGHAAGQHSTSGCGGSVFIGSYAGQNPLDATPFNNFEAVLIGNSAGLSAPAAQYSVHVGSYAGANSSNSLGAVCVGFEAGMNSTVSAYGTHLGFNAGKNATAGSQSILIGWSAGRDLSRHQTLVIESNQTYAIAGVNALIYGEFDNRLLRFGADTVKFQKDLILEDDQTPASATATGTKGMVRWDASYIYICTATDTWKRVAIATW